MEAEKAVAAQRDAAEAAREAAAAAKVAQEAADQVIAEASGAKLAAGAAENKTNTRQGPPKQRDP